MSILSTDDFNYLYAARAAGLRGIVRRILRNPEDVDEVVHEAFLQVWRQRERFDPMRGDVGTWLNVIAKNRALDRLRRRTVRLRVELSGSSPDAWSSTDADPRTLATHSEAATRLRSAWASLPAMTQRVLELTYWEGCSQRQVAARLDQTLGVVKSRMSQGLGTLKHQVNDAGDRPAASGLSRRLRTTGDADAETGEVALTTAAADAPATSFPSLRDLVVLVVDDDVRTREVLEAILRTAGARAIICDSSLAAWRTLRSRWPDILVADIMMPGHDGFAFLRQVRTRSTKPLPAIAFTGLAAESDRTRALEAGFDVHMSKPVHPVALLMAIRKLAAGDGRDSMASADASAA